MSTTAPEQHEMPSPIASVLFVCTGNVCRSPFAELLLRARVPDLRVSSAGVGALAGHPMEQQMAEQARRRGADPAGFRARQVTAEDLGADLVLTMSARQRRYLLEELPGAARRVGLLGHVPELAVIAARRGGGLATEDVAEWSRRSLPPQRDVPDPFGGTPEVAAATAVRVEGLVGQLAQLLTGELPRT